MSGITAMHFELAAVIITFPIVALYLFLLHQYYAGKKNTIIKRLTLILLFIWVKITLQIFTEFWTVYKILEIPIPPINMLIEVGIIGYISATLWKLWWNNKDMKLS